MFNNIDKKFRRIGFVKSKEDLSGTRYVRLQDNDDFHYHVIDITRKRNGEYNVKSFEKNSFNVDNVYMEDTCIALTYYELKLVLKKMKKLGCHKNKH